MPIDREKVLQAAQKYVEKKRYDGAIAEYQKIIQQDPNDARILLKIGDLQARLQAYPEAIATYDRVGQHYATQGFSLKAIAVYKQIREIIKKHAPDLADRYAHIGPRLAEIYGQLGLTSDALSAWDEVATRLQRAGRDREAVDVFRRMVELDRGNPLPHLRLAEACCRVQSLDEAIQSFWTAADLLLNLGRQDDALKVIERILHFRADARFARVAAELYLAKGTREDGLLALAKLQICFQADPKDLETLGLLGQAFTSIGQEGKSIEVYKEMARVAREQGRVDVFEGLVEHLRAVAPDDDQVRALLSSMPPSRRRMESDAVVSVDDVDFIDDDAAMSVVEEEAAPLPLLGGRPGLSSAPDVVIVDDQLEAAEELAESGGFDARAHARKAVVDAESFRKLRLFPKAIETLHIALEIDPRSIEIRTKLRDILAESGDRDGALAESVNLAALHLDRGDNDAAEPLLRQVLESEPQHEGALALYEQIAPGHAPAGGARGAFVPEAGTNDAYGSYDPNAPLPSYDLEEISAEQALYQEPSVRRAVADVLEADEPFHVNESAPPRAALAPSPDPRSLPAFEELDEISQVEEVHFDPGSPGLDVLEQVLEEAEFFAARGLYEDARAVLSEQLSRTPNHRLVLERLREADEQLAAQANRTPSLNAGSNSGFDVSASLDALDRLQLPSDAPGATRNSTLPNARVDAEQVFANFKAGIRAHLTEADSSTHYDLGVAYREMGLLSDALHELTLAARDPQRESMSHAMIGMIYLGQNQLDRAIESYTRALEAPIKSAEQELSLYYDLANAYELKGKPDQSLEYFQKITERNPGYRDVAERIQALTASQDKPETEPSGTRSVAEDDEFERVFDDLFESK